MALARRRHVYSVLDGKGKRSAIIIYSDHIIPADADTFNGQIKTALEPLVTGTIEQWGYFTVRGTDNASPDNNADRQEKATISYKDNDTLAMVLSIPTIDEQFFITGTDILDLGKAQVAAFNNLMLAEATTNRAVGLESVIKGKEVFK